MTNDIYVFGPADERARTQLETCIAASGKDDEPIAVLCGDHHPGYSMPIGGVLALRHHVMPAGVGYDIACGNCAVRTNVKAADVDVANVMDELWRVLSFGIGRKNAERVDSPVLDAISKSPIAYQQSMTQLAAAQLGTVGSGNHYVDLFEDVADGSLWVGVHFGSRGFGHKTATGFLAVAAGKDITDRVPETSMDSVPLLLDTRQPSGQDYITAMHLAGDYAYAGREWVVGKVLSVLGASETLRVHNHHNFAWREQHQGEDYWVVRKGATPAFPGQCGFVGGTMGSNAVILRGVESDQSAQALYSTVHGAGRTMGRRQAAGRTRIRKRWQCLNYRSCAYSAQANDHRKEPNGPAPKCPACGSKLQLRRVTERLTEGLVDWPQWQAAIAALGIELRGAGPDEAPQCYKDLDAVLAHHAGTVEILHVLRPIGVAMAGPDTDDPYKD
jgi:tRNA-splicing ligase RtcB